MRYLMFASCGEVKPVTVYHFYCFCTEKSGSGRFFERIYRIERIFGEKIKGGI